MQPFADQGVDAEHQFLHARRALASFVTDDNDISRDDLSRLYRVECRPVSVEYLCFSFEVSDLFVYCRGAYDGAVGREISP